MRAGKWRARENQGTNVPTEGSRNDPRDYTFEQAKKLIGAVMIAPAPTNILV